MSEDWSEYGPHGPHYQPPYKEPKPKELDDEELRQWVLNDEGLYNWQQQTGLDVGRFVKQNRVELQGIIRATLSGEKQPHHLAYGPEAKYRSPFPESVARSKIDRVFEGIIGPEYGHCKQCGQEMFVDEVGVGHHGHDGVEDVDLDLDHVPVMDEPSEDEKLEREPGGDDEQLWRSRVGMGRMTGGGGDVGPVGRTWAESIDEAGTASGMRAGPEPRADDHDPVNKADHPVPAEDPTQPPENQATPSEVEVGVIAKPACLSPEETQLFAELKATPEQVKSYCIQKERWAKVGLPQPLMGDPKCLMVQVWGESDATNLDGYSMWLGIEPDGYTHS